MNIRHRHCSDYFNCGSARGALDMSDNFSKILNDFSLHWVLVLEIEEKLLTLDDRDTLFQGNKKRFVFISTT